MLSPALVAAFKLRQFGGFIFSDIVNQAANMAVFLLNEQGLSYGRKKKLQRVGKLSESGICVQQNTGIPCIGDVRYRHR